MRSSAEPIAHEALARRTAGARPSSLSLRVLAWASPYRYRLDPAGKSGACLHRAVAHALHVAESDQPKLAKQLRRRATPGWPWLLTACLSLSLRPTASGFERLSRARLPDDQAQARRAACPRPASYRSRQTEAASVLPPAACFPSRGRSRTCATTLGVRPGDGELPGSKRAE